MLNRQEVLQWLKEENENRLNDLWNLANSVRQQSFMDKHHIYGLITISNYCIRSCVYCGINSRNHSIQRYRLTQSEIMDCAFSAKKLGFERVVLESGEDYGVKSDWLAQILHRIRKETNLSITLSLSERPNYDLTVWHNAGVDTYFLNFETSYYDLYKRIHPKLINENKSDRFGIIKKLYQIGYKVGSGIIVGIPGQTYNMLADDIEIFKNMNFNSIEINPYYPHPQTLLYPEFINYKNNLLDQVSNNILMMCKVLALTKIVCPSSNIQSVYNFDKKKEEIIQRYGFKGMPDILMHNLTLEKYKKLYDIYPEEAM